MQNAPREHSAILLTFIKLPFVLKTFILSIFEWPLKTGFTVDLLGIIYKSLDLSELTGISCFSNYHVLEHNKHFYRAVMFVGHNLQFFRSYQN